MRTIDAEERRARLARRHRLARGERAGDVVEAARSLVCLHGTDPATIYLSAWARVEAMTVADMDRALYRERSLVKHLAMRRTLFVFPRETMGDAQAGASHRVEGAERRRVVREVERVGLHADGEAWLAAACREVLAALPGGREARSAELRREIPLLEGSIAYGEGKSWGGNIPIGPRVLTVLSAAGRIVRATNDGPWYTSRPRWASMDDWLGERLAPPSEAEGVAGLVEGWLRAFGPGTAADLKWWLGSTVTAVRRALADVGAAGGGPGRADRLPAARRPRSTPSREPWAALLPPLDPTTMGWYERDWYLGPHRRSSSTRPATPVPRSGGTAGPWAAGARTRPAPWCSRCWRTWARTRCGRSRTRRPG